MVCEAIANAPDMSLQWSSFLLDVSIGPYTQTGKPIMFDELSATLFLKIVAVIFGAALGIVGILAEHDNNKPLTNKTKAVIFGIGASLIIGVLVTLAESEEQAAKEAKVASNWEKSLNTMKQAEESQKLLRSQANEQIGKLDNIDNIIGDLNKVQGEMLIEQTTLNEQSKALGNQIDTLRGLIDQSQKQIIEQQAAFSDLYKRMANPFLPAIASVKLTLDFESSYFEKIREYLDWLVTEDKDAKSVEERSRINFYSRQPFHGGDYRYYNFPHLDAETIWYDEQTGVLEQFEATKFYVPHGFKNNRSAPQWLSELSINLELHKGEFVSSRAIDDRLPYRGDVSIQLNRTALPTWDDAVPLSDLPDSLLQAKDINETYVIELSRNGIPINEVSVVVIAQVDLSHSNILNLSPTDFKTMLASAVIDTQSEERKKEALSAIKYMEITFHTGQGMLQETTFRFRKSNLDRVGDDQLPAFYTVGADSRGY